MYTNEPHHRYYLIDNVIQGVFFSLIDKKTHAFYKQYLRCELLSLSTINTIRIGDNSRKPRINRIP